MSDLFRAHLGDTPLSDDERQGLIPSLSNQRELNEFEFENISSAERWATNARRIAGLDVLNASYLLDLHKRMFNATWRWAGQFRTTQKTIGVEPHRIVSDLSALLGDAKYWVENHTHAADEIALRFHHRLVFIHPFSNGNGRHARLAADIVALKLGRPIFPWGANTATPSAVGAAYLDALRLADHQDYTALFGFARSGEI